MITLLVQFTLCHLLGPGSVLALADQADPKTSGSPALYAEASGSGEPLLLIGGLGNRLEVWHDIRPHLAKRFRVVVFDHRGLGRSPDREGPVTVATMAEDAAEVMARQGFERYHVAGISLGSFAAQALALAHPDRVRNLVLISSSMGGPTHVPPDAEVLQFFQTSATMPREEAVRKGLALALHPSFAEAAPERLAALVSRESSYTPPPAVIQRQVMAGLMFNHIDRVAQIAQPTLVIHGDGDRVVPPINGEKLAKALPKGRWLVLERGGHLCIIDQAEPLANAMITFLEESSQEDPATH
ncbi:Alpha/beta fold hydrolase [Sulfidibacter corallicola]|uniref:Alpha/beta fold hydrolase n=1 Tax=Sulfidibacter corallicola TaxID=2818388 RepID=A0A8A4TKN2_SULCO|nr:alpha/beta hydrolase [Sulfidibacter corallicola]QTD50037.1 alpha/beta fold hydrolase [Sulfidibacter corallicola]